MYRRHFDKIYIILVIFNQLFITITLENKGPRKRSNSLTPTFHNFMKSLDFNLKAYDMLITAHQGKMLCFIKHRYVYDR